MKIGARIGSIASIALLVGLAGAACMSMRGPSASDKMSGAFDGAIAENARRLMDEGRMTFRHDTFGSEEFWGGALQLHQAIAGQKHGGVGAGVSPKQALAVGLKVDVAALPPALVDALKAGKVDLDDPGSTLALLKANGVVGVTGFFDPQGRIPPWASSAHSAIPRSTTPWRPASATGSTDGPTAISISGPSWRWPPR
jgi:hypothetical protein